MGHVSFLYCFVSILVQIAAVTLAAALLHFLFGDKLDPQAMTVGLPSGIISFTLSRRDFKLLQLPYFCGAEAEFEVA